MEKGHTNASHKHAVQPGITITALSNTKLIDTEQIDLQCTGNDYPESTIQVGIPESSLIKFTIYNYSGCSVIRSGSHLVISNLTTNDSGVYYCIGSSLVGSANESINITVFPGLRFFWFVD